MSNRSTNTYPAEKSHLIDNRIRRWIQDPYTILNHFIKPRMTVLEVGCGSGFFSVDIAKLLGDSGKLIAADLQEEMLEKLKYKVRGTDYENRIFLHKCSENEIGVKEEVDFVLAFYMVHETANQSTFLKEIWEILKNEGCLLIVEPPFHVSKSDFEKTVTIAKNVGFSSVSHPKIFLSKSVLLKKIEENG